MKNQRNKLRTRINSLRGRKVIVAMSGGVDSSVAAALLKRAGFSAIGVFMKFWAESAKNGLVGAWNRCCSPEAEKRARRVANLLGIPFYVFNFEKEFKKRIVDYFLAEYKASRTPNPCVVCNKEIKFGLLLEKALSLEADFVATGHYARLGREIRNPKSEIRNYKYKLLKGRDKDKDQSYFLWQLNQEQLKHILFPIGDYTKTQTRSLAKKFKLPVFDTQESMEICFIQTTINDFLKGHLKPKPGKIIDTKGNKIGQHQGLYLYTIGQRKGMALPGGPYYVLDKDLKKNLLVVTKNEKDLLIKELGFEAVNWISGKMPKFSLKVKAKIRYRHTPASAVLISNRRIVFDKPQRAITPGQSVVFYKGQELLGGGIIV